MKKIFIIFLITLIFTSSVLADEADGVRVGVIDTGVSAIIAGSEPARI